MPSPAPTTPFSDPTATKNAGRTSMSGRFVSRLLKACDIGRISVRFPNGERVEHTGSIPGPHAVLQLRNWRAIRRLLFGGHLGFAEAYIDGDWESPDLAAFIECAAPNQDLLGRELRQRVPPHPQSHGACHPRQHQARQPPQYRGAL